jgi:hypothetical protein
LLGGVEDKAVCVVSQDVATRDARVRGRSVAQHPLLYFRYESADL